MPDSSRTPRNLAESGYDAAFLLAYATTKAAREGAWPRGPELASALDELHCEGEDVQVVRAHRGEYPGQVDNVAQNPGGCFNFEGASGPLDFKDSELSTRSPKAKDPTADFALWCLRETSDGDATTNLQQYFSSETAEIEATPGVAELSFRERGWCQRSAR